MRILVISHTDHYIDSSGTIVGWGPTVREIDMLAERFGAVTHIACLHTGTAPLSTVAYGNENVSFIAIPPFGGTGWKNKLNILTSAWGNLIKIRKALRKADVFQFRAPTSIGLYVIPYLSFFSRKKGWYKYAGNWIAERPPLSYAIQKWMLLHLQSRKVTINGAWPHQPSHCISFENPCLDDADRISGAATIANKEFDGLLTLCFVGRLDKEKGLDEIIEAVSMHPQKDRIQAIHIVGDGPHKHNLEEKIKDVQLPIVLHGALPRNAVFDIYRRSHFLLLPSRSEGFPKVVAEAANFGCIPIVSDVSSISQYVNDNNGYLWDTNESSFADFFCNIDLNNTKDFKNRSAEAHKMAANFTYTVYLDKLSTLILA